LLVVTKANESLKKTLGEMTIAITAKDKEIDRLQRSACSGQEKARPRVPTRPDRKSVSESAAVRAKNAAQTASTQGAAR
jgi:hypothetical protein